MKKFLLWQPWNLQLPNEPHIQFKIRNYASSLDETPNLGAFRKTRGCKSRIKDFIFLGINNHRGYSLIEVMVVIGVVLLLLLLSINVGSYMHRLMVRADIEKLYMTCKYLQQMARTTHSEQQLIFDGNNYVYHNKVVSLTSNTSFAILPNIMGPPSNPQSVITKPITFKNNRINFYQDGTIDAGSAYLVDSLNKQQYSLTCAIGGSSYIRLYKHAHQWQLIDLE